MIPDENRVIVYEDKRALNETEKKLRIIAFNDVYNIEPAKDDPVGGAARFKTALDHFRSEQPCLVLFAGDALSPSTLSLFAKGSQMVHIFNELKIDAAAIGNHEFDMGLDILDSLIKKSEFPWVLSNVFDADTSSPFVDAKVKLVLEINGFKVGVFALAEKDWCKSLCCVKFEDLKYEAYVEVAKNLSKELKEIDKVDLIIALTHMRWNNDENLAERCPEIDFIVGGHDHDYVIKKVKDHLVIKSGTDFREFSVVDVVIDKSENINQTSRPYIEQIEKVIVDSKIAEDEKIKSIVDDYLKDTIVKLERQIGVINCDLDGRTDSVRNGETNLGNFLCDIVTSAVPCDCCIINGGALRSDRIHPAGPFKIRDLRDILSFESELIALTVKGSELHQLLENCVSKYGQGGGRYPQVSNLFFAFDPSKEPGQRINTRLIEVNGEPLDLEKEYVLCTNIFLKNVDPVLKTCPVAISSEDIPYLYNLVENYFGAIESRKNNTEKKHLPSIVSRNAESNLVYELADHVLKRKPIERKNLSFDSASMIITKALKSGKVARRTILLYKDRKIIKESNQYKQKMRELESKPLKLAPQCEQRSILIKDSMEYDALVLNAEHRRIKKSRANMVREKLMKRNTAPDE